MSKDKTKGLVWSAARISDGWLLDAQRSGHPINKAGKHVALLAGPLDRGGKLKLLDSETEVERWIRDENIHDLIEAAGRVLHGRNATVFEGSILNPLRGLPAKSDADLAGQFGVPTARIYRIKDDCKKRVSSELARMRAERDARRAIVKHPRVAAETFEECNICRRRYALSVWPKRRKSCLGHFGKMGPATADLHPECLISRREQMWRVRKAELTPEKVSELRAELKNKINADEERYREWHRRSNERFARERLEVEAILRARDEELTEKRESEEIERVFGKGGGEI